jgi:hypothetical protein
MHRKRVAISAIARPSFTTRSSAPLLSRLEPDGATQIPFLVSTRGGY